MASGGGGGNWIGGLVGGISAGAGVRGYNNAVGSANKYYQQMYSPSSINGYAQQYNPWVWNAIQGGDYHAGTPGTSNFQRDIYNIAQGKDISPWLLNQPLNQINQGQQQNLARAQSIIGRNGMQGGLANAYALANLGGANTARADLMNRYGQFRETQRRSDLNWLLGQVQNSQNQGRLTANDIAGSHGFKKNFWQKLSAFGAGYASGEGGTAAPAAPQVGNNYKPTGDYSYPGNSPQQNAYVGSLGSQGNWYSPSGQYGATASQQNYVNNLGGQGSGNWYNPYGAQSSVQTGSNPNWYSWKQ